MTLIFVFANTGNAQVLDKQSVTYLSDRITAVYNDHSDNREEKYTSTEYYNIHDIEFRSYHSFFLWTSHTDNRGALA